MRTHLLAVLAVLCEADDSVSIAPYKTDDNLDDRGGVVTKTSTLLRKGDDAPTSITALGRLFFGAKPNDKGGMVFAQVHLVHNEPIENILADTKTELEEKSAFLSLQPIQHWDVSNIGFLKNLYWDIDTDALASFLQAQLQSKHRAAVIPIGLKVKSPYDGQKKADTKKVPFRERIQAIHVSVQGQFRDLAVTHIKSILQSSAFKRRYAVEVRLIPLFDRRDSPHTQEKIKRCIVSHGQFCRSVDYMACTGIAHLDQKNKALKKTIRELVVGLPGAHFLSIDLNWRRDSYNILFPKKYDEIARNHIAHLGAYLHKAYGDGILPSLPAETQEQIATTQWSKSGEPMSQVDVELDAILAADEQIEFIDLTALKEPETTRPPPSLVSNTFVPQLDDATISTFGQVPPQPVVTPQKSGESGDSVLGAQTCISGITLDSRVSHMEERFSSMELLLKQFYQEFKDRPTKPSEEPNPPAESAQADSAAQVQ